MSLSEAVKELEQNYKAASRDLNVVSRMLNRCQDQIAAYDKERKQLLGEIADLNRRLGEAVSTIEVLRPSVPKVGDWVVFDRTLRKVVFVGSEYFIAEGGYSARTDERHSSLWRFATDTEIAEGRVP